MQGNRLWVIADELHVKPATQLAPVHQQALFQARVAAERPMSLLNHSTQAKRYYMSFSEDTCLLVMH
jgi:hypothetical protein